MTLKSQHLGRNTSFIKWIMIEPQLKTKMLPKSYFQFKFHSTEAIFSMLTLFLHFPHKCGACVSMWENLFSFKKTKNYVIGRDFMIKEIWKLKEKKIKIFKDDNLEKEKKKKLFFKIKRNQISFLFYWNICTQSNKAGYTAIQSRMVGQEQ